MKTKTQKSLLVTASFLMALSLTALMLAPISRAQEDVIPAKTTDVAAADTQVPSDIENVKAIPGDGQVSLTWNVATDNVGVKGYKIYYGSKPVVSDGNTYEKGPIDVGNKITGVVSGLTNGTPYYFAVTAYDAAGNESENYSTEVSATPNHQAADTAAPTVVKAEAVDNQRVKVTFSEAVTLPTLTPEAAFSIKNDATSAALEVKRAMMDVTDAVGRTIVLTTATQDAGTNYIVTAGIQVKDTSGNPIVSGTSDTALFAGSAVQEGVQTQQTTASVMGPSLVSVTALDPTHVKVNFNEPVKLGANPVDNFIITEEKTIENTLAITQAQLDANETSVTLTTAPQQTMNYNLIAVDITDKAGNPINVDNNATVFYGALGAETQQATQQTQLTQETQAATDKTPPEDATNLAASLAGKLVHLIWQASKNSAGDLMNYVLYQGTDGVKYSAGVLLDPTAIATDVSELVPGVKYFFKLTARDKSGNESKGVVTTFTLPSTGPELGLLVLGSLGLGKFLKRKKNRK